MELAHGWNAHQVFFSFFVLLFSFPFSNLLADAWEMNLQFNEISFEIIFFRLNSSYSMIIFTLKLKRVYLCDFTH